MKKYVSICFLIVLLSCDDGDITIESVDFDAVNLDFCDNNDDLTATTFFFKIENDEALLLNLTSGLIRNETVIDSIEISAESLPSLTYRLFNGDVDESYFCDQVPPLEPTVIQENTATGGTIEILTNVASVSELAKNYNHAITIKRLSLTNVQGERLTENDELNYGNFSTPIVNSPSLEAPFSNYDDTAVALCDAVPTEGLIRLHKLLADEYIFLDIPITLLANAATEENAPRTANLSDNIVFRNVVLDTLVSEEIACSTELPTDNVVGDFITSSGTVSVSTEANGMNTEGLNTYTHTISLNDFRLTLTALDPDSSDVNLSEIETYTFGTIITTVN